MVRRASGRDAGAGADARVTARSRGGKGRVALPLAGTGDGDRAAASGGAMPEPRQRVDQWLWQARFFKTRAGAGEMVASGLLRLNARRVEKAAQLLRCGDVLTFPQAGRIRVIAVRAMAQRRGPASEAQGLYDDLEATGRDAAAVPHDTGSPGGGSGDREGG